MRSQHSDELERPEPTERPELWESPESMGSMEQSEPEAPEAEASEPRWLTVEERSAWRAVAALITLLPGELDARLRARSDLTFFEYMVMSVLSERPDRSMRMSDLARLASSSLSRLSHAASRLEKQGFLERSRLPGAGRRTMATLTDAGMDKVVEAAPGHAADVRELLIDVVEPEHLPMLRAVGESVVGRIDPDLGCPSAQEGVVR